MPAFKLPAEDGEGEEIMFAASLAAIDPEISGAVPTPEFDQYESLGFVPVRALIENGWSLYCDECDRRSDCEEDEDYENRPVEHTFIDSQLFYFCSPDCAKVCLAHFDRMAADRTEFRAKQNDVY